MFSIKRIAFFFYDKEHNLDGIHDQIRLKRFN